MYTRHGHQIAGTLVEGERPPVARCGGPGICPPCNADVVNAQIKKPLTATPHEEADTYQGKAVDLVYNYIKGKLEKTDTHVVFSKGQVYVVWFAKTLQNWKALVSTTLPDGMYYEVTYNGDKAETYIDAYKKFDNVCIPDAPDNSAIQSLPRRRSRTGDYDFD